jgi:putative ABC transport system permease protein
LQAIHKVSGVLSVGVYQPLPAFYREPRNSISAGAVNVEEFLDASPNIVLSGAARKAMMKMRTGAIVGRALAARWGWKVGDKIVIRSPITRRTNGSDAWEFEVAGIYDNRLGASDFYLHYQYLDEARVSAKGRVTLFIAKIDNPSHAAQMIERIDTLFANSSHETQTQSEKDWMRGQIDQIGDVAFFINAIIAAVLFTILFVTGNAMMQSVRERSSELAVLKAFGFSDSAVAGLLMGESLTLCLGGAALGILLAALCFPGVFRSMGLGAFPIPVRVIAAGAVIAFLLALASAIPPTWLGRRVPVSAALAGRAT